MVCRHYGGAIICGPTRRRFTYKRRIYFVEEFGQSRAIWDQEEDKEVEFWDFTGRKLSKFRKEINKGD